LKNYPIPKEFQVHDIFFEDPAIKALQEYWFKKKDPITTQEQYSRLNVLRDVFDFLGKPPSAWTKDDLVLYIKTRTAERGWAKGTVQKKLIAIRDFIAHGLKETWHEDPEFEVGKMAIPKERTYTFDPKDVPRMLSIVDKLDKYKFTYKIEGKEKTERIKLSPIDKALCKTAILLSASTGARSGKMPTVNDFIQAVVTGKEHYARPTDLQCVNILNINFAKRKIIKAYAKWHREKGWKGIPIPPKTFKAMKEYLGMRFEINPNLPDEEFERQIKAKVKRLIGIDATDMDDVLNYYISRMRDVCKDVISMKIPDHEKIEMIKHDKEKMKMLKHIHKEFIEKWRITQVIPEDSMKTLRKCLKAIVHYAKHVEKKALEDQYGDAEWTIARMKEKEHHTWHLLRRLYAQTLIAHGIPFEVIMDYGFGWRDLSTLKGMYGSMPRERIKEVESVLQKLY